jgi:hypothetical protein
MNSNNSDPGAFEMSIRVLGNEFIGFRIVVDDFKTKWLVLSIFGAAAISAIVANYGLPIKNLFAS